MAEIAACAGIGKGTIYEYFNSKEDLFFAVFEWYMKQSGAAATVSISVLGGSAASRLMALSDSLIRTWVTMMDVYPLVWSSGQHRLHPKCANDLKRPFGTGMKIFATLFRP